MDKILLKRGASAYINMSILDNDDAPYDLSSAYLYFTVKEYKTDTDEDAIIAKTIGNGITIDDAPNGLLSLELDPVDTSAFVNYGPRYMYYWDVMLENGNEVAYPLSGILTVEDTVRRGT